MSQFYFDLRSQNTAVTDKVGTKLPNVDAAKQEATVAAAEWLRDHASVAGTEVKVSVRNGHGPAPLFHVTASIKLS